MAFLTPDFFNLLVVVVIILGLALAVVRLYDDLTRPLPPEETPFNPDEDTQPHRAVAPEQNHTPGE